MITVLARFEMLKGKEDAALDAMRKMADDVKAQEPGCLMYSVTRGQVNPLEVYIYEAYADQPAFEAHRKTQHMRDLQATFDEALDRGSFNVEILNVVAGFIRPEAAG